jgi:hypothetical protein
MAFFSMFMLGVSLQIISLWFILFIVARNEGDLEFTKVFLANMAILIGTLLITMFLFRHISFLVVIPILLLTIFVLMQLCLISFPKALLVTVIFITLNTLMIMGLEKIFEIDIYAQLVYSSW